MKLYSADKAVYKKLKRGHNSHNNKWILPKFDVYLYFMIIYLCIKYEYNILIFSKDDEQKPFLTTQYRKGVKFEPDLYFMIIYISVYKI